MHQRDIQKTASWEAACAAKAAWEAAKTNNAPLAHQQRARAEYVKSMRKYVETL